MLEKLHQSITARDAAVLKQTAHKLIGSLGVFGADQAVDCARELENLAADHAFAPAEKMIARLRNEV